MIFFHKPDPIFANVGKTYDKRIYKRPMNELNI